MFFIQSNEEEEEEEEEEGECLAIQADKLKVIRGFYQKNYIFSFLSVPLLVWLHSRRGESCRESTREISRGHEKLKRVQGSGKTGGNTRNADRPGRSTYFFSEFFTVLRHSWRRQVWTASCDNIKG